MNSVATEDTTTGSNPNDGELRLYLGEHHYELTEDEVFDRIFDRAPAKYSVTRVRIPNSDGKTRMMQICQIPAYVAEHPFVKHFAMPGILRKIRNKKGKLKYNQTEKGVGRIFWRVLDFDCKNGVANEEQAEELAILLPGALISWANGLQAFIRPSWHWSRDSLFLAVLGQFIEKQIGLHYDPQHFNFEEGEPHSHENHAFRIPGYADRAGRRVRFFAPEVEEDLNSTFERLGLKLPVVVKNVGKCKNTNRVATNQARGMGTAMSTSSSAPAATIRSVKLSQGDKYNEFSDTMKMMHTLRRQGLSFESACDQVATQHWVFCKEQELRKSFAKYFEFWSVGGGYGEFVSNDKDQIIYKSFLIDSPTKKQKTYQRTWALFAHRAWALNILYDFGFNEKDCVRAFVRWDIFKKIRRLSLAAVSRRYLKKDLKRSFGKYASGFVVRQAKPEIIEKVKQLILTTFSSRKQFKTFELDLLKDQAGVQSKRHLNRVLNMLEMDGYLLQVGKYMNAVWRFSNKLIQLIQQLTQIDNNICMAHGDINNANDATHNLVRLESLSENLKCDLKPDKNTRSKINSTVESFENTT